jgi:hypothetical protein
MEDTEMNDVEVVEEPDFVELGFDPVALVEAALSGRGGYIVDDDDSVMSSRPRDMPNIDHLVDAVDVNHQGVASFMLPPGSRLVIERRSGLLQGRPWIDTKVYEVREIDQETGLLKLWNPEARHHARDNFKAGVKVGSKYKVPPAKGKWDAPPKVVKSPPPVVVQSNGGSEDGQPVKRGRGRPPGVKNRSKEAIAEEKAIRAAMKIDRRGKRK